MKSLYSLLCRALESLQEQKRLEASLDGIKSQLGISNTSKENFKTLMEENEMILKYVGQPGY